MSPYIQGKKVIGDYFDIFIDINIFIDIKVDVNIDIIIDIVIYTDVIIDIYVDNYIGINWVNKLHRFAIDAVKIKKAFN